MPMGALSRLEGYLASPRLEHAPRQVVMLGAGMDSRPWRLKLPAGERRRRRSGPVRLASPQLGRPGGEGARLVLWHVCMEPSAQL
jgi:hypothetical protein